MRVGSRRRRRRAARGARIVRKGALTVAMLGTAVALWVVWDGDGKDQGDGPDPSEPARTLEADTQSDGAPGDGLRGEAPADERVRVEVLNAGGVAGAAAGVRDELRDRGFDVVYWGNADQFDREETTVVDRAGHEEWARRVAVGLGVDGVRSEPDPSRLLEVTVLVGSDWEPLEEAVPEAETEEEAPSALRRWLQDVPGF